MEFNSVQSSWCCQLYCSRKEYFLLFYFFFSSLKIYVWLQFYEITLAFGRFVWNLDGHFLCLFSINKFWLSWSNIGHWSEYVYGSEDVSVIWLIKIKGLATLCASSVQKSGAMPTEVVWFRSCTHYKDTTVKLL